METAVIKEINREYLEAVKCYEEAIADDSTSTQLDNYINLAFLYWSFAFELFEFNIPNNIPENWSIIGGNTYPKILELGLKNYPNSLELNFWKKYFSHISYGQEFSKEDCQQLIEKYGDDSIVPYFFLYLFDKEKYKEKKTELLEACSQLPTAKNLYIQSVIGN